MTNRQFTRILFVWGIGVTLILCWFVFFKKQTVKVVEPIKNVAPVKVVNAAGDTATRITGEPIQFAYREKKLIDSLAKVYGVREKYLTEYVIFLQDALASVPPVEGTKAADYAPATKPDCPPVVKNWRQTFSNPYYRIRAQIGDSSYLHLQAFDTITVLWNKGKEGRLFARKNTLSLTISSSNPYNRIDGIRTYKAPDNRIKRFGLGLQAGYGWQKGFMPAPYVGIGVSYNFLRL